MPIHQRLWNFYHSLVKYPAPCMLGISKTVAPFEISPWLLHPRAKSPRFISSKNFGTTSELCISTGRNGECDSKTAISAWWPDRREYQHRWFPSISLAKCGENIIIVLMLSVHCLWTRKMLIITMINLKFFTVLCTLSSFLRFITFNYEIKIGLLFLKHPLWHIHFV